MKLKTYLVWILCSFLGGQAFGYMEFDGGGPKIVNIDGGRDWSLHACMARLLRIEFPGAIYHVRSRMVGSWSLDRGRR